MVIAMRVWVGALVICSTMLEGQAYRFTPGDPLVIVQNGKYGYIDHKGQMVIPPQFLWGSWFEQGVATVYLCGREVSIDRNGTVFRKRIARDDELVPKTKDRKVGFIDKAGVFKIAPVFDDAMPFSGGFAAVKVAKNWGFIDSQGEMAIQPRFTEAFYFVDGVASATLGKDYVIINKTGAVIAEGYSYANVAEGRIPLSRDTYSGFLDRYGNVVIPFVYEEVGEFSEGLAAVEQNSKWGFVDRDGKVAIPLDFDSVSAFSKGLAAAKLGKKTGFIDHFGKFVFETPFRDSPGFLADDIAVLFMDGGGTAYVTTSGRVIWGPTRESPEHPPLTGWSKQDRSESCKGIPKALRKRVASFR